MTKALKEAFIKSFGTGTGPTMYDHFRNLVIYGGVDLPMGMPHRIGWRRKVTDETARAYSELTPEQRLEQFEKYRRNTKDMMNVRLSDYRLEAVVAVVLLYVANLQQVPE